MHEIEKWKWSCSVCLTLSDPMDCSLPGSSVHGIFQARVLEWGAIAFSRIYVYISAKNISRNKLLCHKVWIYLVRVGTVKHFSKLVLQLYHSISFFIYLPTFDMIYLFLLWGIMTSNIFCFSLITSEVDYLYMCPVTLSVPFLLFVRFLSLHL